jgi:benzylsuccinate CoA-transferase BbsF subunit
MTEPALEGLKVVDFCWVAAGPIVSLYLAHHGATVVRIESMRRPDILRAVSPYKDNVPGVNRSGNWDFFNSGKLGMSINLSHPKGLEIAKKLVKWSDVVGESFAPGVIERLGLGYNELKKIKPDIIMYSSSNLGQTGPEARQPGYGVHLVSYSGFTHLTGWPDRLSTQPYGAYTDFLAPRFLVAALLAALDYRRRTGKGQYLDISQLECAVHFIAPAIMDYTVNKRVETRVGNKCPHAAPHGAYPCQGDDRWCAIAVFDDEEWDTLCQVMDNPDWTKRPEFTTLLSRKKNEEELNKKIGEWTRNFTAEELMEKLQSAGVPAGVVKNAADVQDDPQLAYRHYFWQLEHPEIGRHNYEGPGFILSKTPAEIERPAPLMGQHTEYVCREILGMSDEEFVDLLSQGVFE